MLLPLLEHFRRRHGSLVKAARQRSLSTQKRRTKLSKNRELKKSGCIVSWHVVIQESGIGIYTQVGQNLIVFGILRFGSTITRSGPGIVMLARSVSRETEGCSRRRSGRGRTKDLRRVQRS